MGKQAHAFSLKFVPAAANLMLAWSSYFGRSIFACGFLLRWPDSREQSTNGKAATIANF
jgi:hypothetical protein